ncbi:MAG: 3-phosphoshikimate 1-carboxyvinyltransferase [Bacillota bacterium]|nr:3-phosphoshikimate 1-carboxyvinyltransferase [Bacillota bacterium]
MEIIIKPSKLKGEVNIPPSKSLSHRAIIAASLSNGISEIENIILSDDIKATIEAMKNFGVEINKEKIENRYKLAIKGKDKFELNNNVINCNESGSTLRFLIPFFSLVNDEVIFTGENKLIERPLETYYKIFDENRIEYSNDFGKLPLKISGSLKSGIYEVDGDISSQFITGLMFILPILDGDSEIVINKELESKSYIDLTLNILKRFGIIIKNNNYKNFIIKGNQKYISNNYKVEGDYSQASFWIVSNLLGNNIIIKDLNEYSIQGDKVILKIIKKMGADYKFEGNNLIVLNKNNLKNIEIDAKDCPDLVPILSVLASFADGKCRIYNAKRLRFKESDRLKAISSQINLLGGKIIEVDDGLEIYPVKDLIGGNVESWNDHRIAMALTIISTKIKDNIYLSNAEAINKSYPEFYNDFKKLGGKIYV